MWSAFNHTMTFSFFETLLVFPFFLSNSSLVEAHCLIPSFYFIRCHEVLYPDTLTDPLSQSSISSQTGKVGSWETFEIFHISWKKMRRNWYLKVMDIVERKIIKICLSVWENFIMLRRWFFTRNLFIMSIYCHFSHF